MAACLKLWLSQLMLTLALLLCNASASAWSEAADLQRLKNCQPSTAGHILAGVVRDNYAFAGLASYLNNVSYHVVSRTDIRALPSDDIYQIKDAEWLVAVGRFKVLALKQPGMKVQMIGQQLLVLNPSVLASVEECHLVDKPALGKVANELMQARYVHLWPPLALMASLAEKTLALIHQKIVANWVWALVFFSLLVKLLLYPVTRYTQVVQTRVNLVQRQLEPQLAYIKQHYEGEDAHHRAMAAHKQLGVTPFFSLKPMLVTLIQFPVLIATFNALADMPQWSEVSWLWIDNLAYPDSVGLLPFTLNFFGSQLSLLPLVLMAVTLLSMPTVEQRSQRRHIIYMALGFLILFYPFPSSLVLYWILVTVWQAVFTAVEKWATKMPRHL